MEKIRLIRQTHLDDLKLDIMKNTPAYMNSDTSQFPHIQSVSFEIELEADLASLSKLRPTKEHKDEVFNCILVWKALSNITPELARDERLWTYLTHYHALAYSTKRWPPIDETKKTHNFIKNHFFAQTKRNVERDNAISRLWWMAFIANKAESGTLKENLDALLAFSDVRANIIERPTTGRSKKVRPKHNSSSQPNFW